MSRRRQPLTWGMGLVLAHVGLVAAGGALPTPAAPWTPARFVTWLTTTDPHVVAFSLLRVGALLITWYLLALTVAAALGCVRGLHPLGVLAHRLAIPPVRRLVPHLVGVGLTLSLAGGAIGPVGGAVASAAPQATAVDGPEHRLTVPLAGPAGVSPPGTVRMTVIDEHAGPAEPGHPPGTDPIPPTSPSTTSTTSTTAPTASSSSSSSSSSTTPPTTATTTSTVPPGTAAPPAAPLPPAVPPPPTSVAPTTASTHPTTIATADTPVVRMRVLIPSDPADPPDSPNPPNLPGPPTDAAGDTGEGGLVTAPGPVVPSTAAPTWIIRPGEHLWHVAEATVSQALGRPAPMDMTVDYLHRLIDHNRATLAVPGNADLVFPGQVFELPAVPVPSGDRAA